MAEMEFGVRRAQTFAVWRNKAALVSIRLVGAIDVHPDGEAGCDVAVGVDADAERCRLGGNGHIRLYCAIQVSRAIFSQTRVALAELNCAREQAMGRHGCERWAMQMQERSFTVGCLARPKKRWTSASEGNDLFTTYCFLVCARDFCRVEALPELEKTGRLVNNMNNEQ